VLEGDSAMSTRGRRWRKMADQYKCGKCGKTSPKGGFCCGAPMRKV